MRDRKYQKLEVALRLNWLLPLAEELFVLAQGSPLPFQRLMIQKHVQQCPLGCKKHNDI